MVFILEYELLLSIPTKIKTSKYNTIGTRYIDLLEGFPNINLVNIYFCVLFFFILRRKKDKGAEIKNKKRENKEEKSDG